MRVKMRTTACGPAGSFQAGLEYDVGGELGSELLKAGAAELVKTELELAVVEPVETRGEAAEDMPEWPLKMSPEDYLKKTPNGPKAVLARKILGQ